MVKKCQCFVDAIFLASVGVFTVAASPGRANLDSVQLAGDCVGELGYQIALGSRVLHDGETGRYNCTAYNTVPSSAATPPLGYLSQLVDPNNPCGRTSLS